MEWTIPAADETFFEFEANGLFVNMAAGSALGVEKLETWKRKLALLARAARDKVPALCALKPEGLEAWVEIHFFLRDPARFGAAFDFEKLAKPALQAIASALFDPQLDDAVATRKTLGGGLECISEIHVQRHTAARAAEDRLAARVGIRGTSPGNKP